MKLLEKLIASISACFIFLAVTVVDKIDKSLAKRRGF